MKFVIALLLSNASAVDPAVGDLCNPTEFKHVCGQMTGDKALRCGTAGENSGKCVKASHCDTADGSGVRTTCSEIGATCDYDKNKVGCITGFTCASGPADWDFKCVRDEACTKPVDGTQAECAGVGGTCDSTKAISGCDAGEQCALEPQNLQNTCVKDQYCGQGERAAQVSCAVLGKPCDANKVAHVCDNRSGDLKLRCATAGEATSRCIKADDCGTDDPKKVKQTCSEVGKTCDPTKPMNDTGCQTDGYSCAISPADWNAECVPSKACTEKVDGVEAQCAGYPTKCDSTKAASGCDKDYECATAPAAKMNTCVPKEDCVTGEGDAKIVCPPLGQSCDPLQPFHYCLDNGTNKYRCASSGDVEGRCIKDSDCGNTNDKGVKITCQEMTKKCDSTKSQDKSDCADTFSCVTGPALWKDECILTANCGIPLAVDDGGDWIDCAGTKPSGQTCDSTKPNSGCSDGQQCAINIGEKDSTPENRCVNDDKCGFTAPADSYWKVTCGSLGAPCDSTQEGKGCADGFRCATEPADLNKRCVTKEACGEKVADVETKCEGKTLAASLIAALAIATTL